MKKYEKNKILENDSALTIDELIAILKKNKRIIYSSFIFIFSIIMMIVIFDKKLILYEKVIEGRVHVGLYLTMDRAKNRMYNELISPPKRVAEMLESSIIPQQLKLYPMCEVSRYGVNHVGGQRIDIILTLTKSPNCNTAQLMQDILDEVKLEQSTYFTALQALANDLVEKFIDQGVLDEINYNMHNKKVWYEDFLEDHKMTEYINSYLMQRSIVPTHSWIINDATSRLNPLFVHTIIISFFISLFMSFIFALVPAFFSGFRKISM